MNHHDAIESDADSRVEAIPENSPDKMCPLPKRQLRSLGIDSDFCQTLNDAGCPLAATIHERLAFESLLAELSTKFVNVAANQVDSQIEWGLQRIVALLGIDRSGLGEVSNDRKQLLVTHSYQLPGIPPSAKFMLDSEFPIYARMVHQGMVVRLPNDLPPEAIKEREYCRSTGLKSNLTIPLVSMGTVVGGIGFTSYRSHRILPDELIPRLRLVGDIFTNALARKRADEAIVENEKLLRHAKEGLQQLSSKLLLSQEEERARIAREMHDDWTQRLATLGIDAANLENQVGDATTALPLVQAMRQRLVSLAEDVHALSRQLHPSIIDDLGLADALRSECASFARRENVKVHYAPGNVPSNLPKDIALCIYRVAQESLRNLAKHAAVSEASIKLVGDEHELVLQVCDEGVGFDQTSSHSQPGIGLASMHERVQLVHGKLSIESSLGNGTTIEVRVPVERVPS